MFSTIWSVLSSSLWFWEITGYVCTFVVILGCVGEYIAEFTHVPKTDDEKHRISKLSLIILTVGIAGELLTAIRSSQISGQVIANLQSSVKNAKQSASDAADAADRAERAADGAEGKAEAVGKVADAAGVTAGNSKTTAGSALTEAVDAESKAADLDSQLTSAKRQLDLVDAGAGELEKSLVNMAICNAPRVITVYVVPSGKTTIDPLRSMAGQKVLIEVVNESEAKRAAGSLTRALVGAKWDVPAYRIVDGLDDGVSVQFSSTDSVQDPDARFRASDVADKLVDFLHSNNWEARKDAPLQGEGANLKIIRDPSVLPAGAIRIQIGPHPVFEFVTTGAEKDIGLASAQNELETQSAPMKAQSATLEKIFGPCHTWPIR